MVLPNIMQKIIGNREYTRDTIGLSGSGIYLFEDMVLKIQPVSAESENELRMMQWLQGKVPVPNIIEHIADNECSYILMTKCSGKMACHVPMNT